MVRVDSDRALFTEAWWIYARARRLEDELAQQDRQPQLGASGKRPAASAAAGVEVETVWLAAR